MEALTDDLVFSLAAFLRPRDIVHLALASRRFGGKPGGGAAEKGAGVIDAEARAEIETRPMAKRQRRVYEDATGGEECVNVAGNRTWSLMEEVAKRTVEGYRNFASELLQRQGDESWMGALHRLEGQQRLIEEAMSAAPALFAKPGDILCSQDANSHCFGDSRVEYIGRNEVECPGQRPKKGWLVFHNTGGVYPLSVMNGGIRDTLGAWPRENYSHVDESGEIIEQTLCIPPEMCGPLHLPKEYDDDGNEIPARDIKERVKDMSITTEMLEEAKRALPVLVAKPGDLFSWRGVVVIYKGRNKMPPMPVNIGGTATGPKMVEGAQIGWLVFHNNDERYRGYNCIDILNGGIRDGLRAWPDSVYSHYDESGKRNEGTLCIPPEKCGALKVYEEPEYGDY